MHTGETFGRVHGVLVRVLRYWIWVRVPGIVLEMVLGVHEMKCLY